ncbi:hypothetical protein PIIN_09013 [Serendipita indica DSM 11827]|uniref:Uncharacterized protein n=1 Tax=Serendipita indica (strain DSM 11827) TaxID=1109443 RepID=G4TUN5_SERID|nr:hypothetical protein PIIN_09013 [Serendipita indica DSM 11827]
MSISLQKAKDTAYYMSGLGLPCTGLPAFSDGSANPAQSNKEYSKWPTSTAATSPIKPTPSRPWIVEQYIPLGSTHWARFQVPTDVFLNPHNPVHHHLLYTILWETWFPQQTNK